MYVFDNQNPFRSVGQQAASDLIDEKRRKILRLCCSKPRKSRTNMTNSYDLVYSDYTVCRLPCMDSSTDAAKSLPRPRFC